MPLFHRWSPWERLRKQVVRWSDQTFPRTNTASKALHLREEASELHDAITDYSWPPILRRDHIARELADIFIIAMHLADCEGIDLYEAVRQKLAIVRTREWLPPDENGVIRHKK